MADIVWEVSFGDDHAGVRLKLSLMSSCSSVDSRYASRGRFLDFSTVVRRAKKLKECFVGGVGVVGLDGIVDIEDV